MGTSIAPSRVFTVRRVLEISASTQERLRVLKTLPAPRHLSETIRFLIRKLSLPSSTAFSICYSEKKEKFSIKSCPLALRDVLTKQIGEFNSSAIVIAYQEMENREEVGEVLIEINYSGEATISLSIIR